MRASLILPHTRSWKAVTVVAVLSLFSPNAGAAFRSSQILGDFAISTASTQFATNAKGAKGDLSLFGNVLGAKDVQLSVTDLKTRKAKAYSCSSFTFYLADDLMVCEERQKQSALALDLKTSETTSFPNK